MSEKRHSGSIDKTSGSDNHEKSLHEYTVSTIPPASCAPLTPFVGFVC